MNRRPLTKTGLHTGARPTRKYRTVCLSLLSLLVVSVFAAFPLRAAAFGGGDGTAGSPYVVASAEDLRGVGGAGLYFVQSGDIDLGGEAWNPIGKLEGTYDGGGYKITGLTAPLFSSVGKGGTVKNVTVEDADIKSSSTTGIIAAENEGVIKNCSAGGEISADIGNCYVGGIVGDNDESGRVLSCSCSAFITVTADAEQPSVGGIAGHNYSGGTVAYCSSSAEITAKSSEDYLFAGGVVGNNNGGVSDCSNSGSITATGGKNYVYAGGIAGYCDGSGSVTNCSNSGGVTAGGDSQGRAGGVVGTNYGTIKYSVNSGAVKASGEILYAGGIVGKNDNDNNSKGKVSYCSSSGTVTSDGGMIDNIGGVAGGNGGDITCCGWLEGDGAPENGVEDNDGGNVIGTGKFTSGDMDKIPAALTANIANDTVAEKETTEITFSLKALDGVTELNFEYYAEAEEPEVAGDAAAAETSGNKITVTGLSAGTAGITAKAKITKAYDFSTNQAIDLDAPIEYSRAFSVTVVSSFVNVTSVTLDSSELSLTTAQTALLTATVLPENASDKEITWASSNANVAIVENGSIRPVFIGETTITAAAGECTASCKVSVTEEFVETVAVSHDITEDTLYAGEEYTITAEVAPDDATYKGVEWSVNDPCKAVSVVASDDKTLTLKAEAEGEIVVTALSVGHTDTSDNKACDMARLYVRYPNVTAVELDKKALEIDLNTAETSGTLRASVAPTNAGYDAVAWTVSPDIAEITGEGKWTEVTITPAKGGSATITASAGDCSDSCTLTVIPRYVTAIKQNGETELSLTAGEAAALSVTLIPEDATDTGVTWTSSDESIASVDGNGRVTAHGAGTAVITAAANGSKEPCAVQWTLTITPPAVPVESLSVTPETLTLEAGGTALLSAEILPKNATNQGVTWSSDNTGVAAVDGGGKVTAAAPGSAVITATTNDGGYTAECRVTVTEATSPDDPTPPSHSGGGCSAGWGALALLALVPFALRRRG